MKVHPDILKMFRDLYTHGDQKEIIADKKITGAQIRSIMRKGEGDEMAIDAMFKFYKERQARVDNMVGQLKTNTQTS